jgi:PAS domain-containing protein
MNSQNNTPAGSGQGRMNEKKRDPSKLFILLVLFVFCSIFYYFGEMVNWAAWDALRNNFFYSVHDFHRLLFLAPIIYAAYYFGMRATMIITILTVMVFLPRALFISPYPDPLLRMILFSIIAGIMGHLVALVRRETARRTRLETILTAERDKLTDILARMADGVIIIGPDHRIRFINPSMVRDFGEGTGLLCHEYLHETTEACRDKCRLQSVLAGTVEKWKYEFPDGRAYEVVASPYRDSDGTMCQLTSFRNVTTDTHDRLKQAGSTG